MAAPVLLNPQVLSSGVAALGSIGSSILGGKIASSQLSKQIAASKYLMDYEWSHFKSPKAQVSALASAGINPSVALGQGGSGFSATPSPSIPSMQNVPVPSIGDIGSFVQAMATAKKTGLESVEQDLKNQYEQSVLSDKIKAVGLQNKWTEQQTSNLSEQFAVMVGQCNVMQKEVEKLESEKKLTDKQTNWYDRHMRAEIDELKSSAKYKDAVANLTESQKTLLDNTLDSLTRISNANADFLEQSVDLLQRYGDAQAIVGMLSQVVSSASDFIGNITKFKSLKAVTESVVDEVTSANDDGSISKTSVKRTLKK